MQKETLTISKEADIQPCLGWLTELFTLHGALEVTVSTQKRSRSVLQNSLYWKWCGELGNHMGLSKDEVHLMLKRKFAVPIFTRDDPDYCAMVLAVKEVRKQGLERQAEALAKEITRLTSTTDFTVPQMREYLNDIEMYAAEIGARLTFPEELIDHIVDTNKKE